MFCNSVGGGILGAQNAIGSKVKQKHSIPFDIFMKFGSVGRTDAPIAPPLGVPNVFYSSVGGLVRARARHFGAPRRPLDRNQRKSLNSIGNAKEIKKTGVLTAEVLKKLEFAFPPSMGSKNNNDPHAAWER